MKNSFYIFWCAIVISGCGGKIISEAVKIATADRKFNQAEQLRNGGDRYSPEKQATAEKIYRSVLAEYLELYHNSPNSTEKLKLQLRIAKLYKILRQWENAQKYYRKAMANPIESHFKIGAKRSLIDITKNIDKIEKSIYRYQNRIKSFDGNEKAIEALGEVAEAYDKLEDYRSAIRYYQKTIEEFSEHRSTAQVYFKLGETYFYRLYDYSDEGGWKIFMSLIDRHPNSFEALKARRLLIESKKSLDRIVSAEEIIDFNTNKKAIALKKSGHYISPAQLYKTGKRPVILQKYHEIARAWIELKNYPKAIETYGELIENLSSDKSSVADALYEIGMLQQKLENYSEAIKAYDQLIDKTPTSLLYEDAVYQKAWSYQKNSQFTLAMENYKIYLSLHRPENLNYHDKAKVAIEEISELFGEGK